MSPRARKETSRYESSGHQGVELDRRSRIYYFRGTVDNDDLEPVFIERSLRTKSLEEALRRARRLRANVAQGVVGRGKKRRMKDGFELVLKIQSTPGKAGKTTTQAISQIQKHLMPWFEKHCPSLSEFVKSYESVWADYQATGSARRPPAHLKTEEEREQWHKLHPAPRKLEHDRRYLVMMLKRARKAGWIRRDFEKDDFPLNEVTEPIGEYISDADAKRLLKAAHPFPKMRLQILLALHLGLRRSEILRLRVEEIDLQRQEINLDPKRLKTRRPREVPIPIVEGLLGALEAAVRAAQGPYLFPAETRRFQKGPGGRVPVITVDLARPQEDHRYHWDLVRQEAAWAAYQESHPNLSREQIIALGVPPLAVRFHDLRHTAITNLLMQGVKDFTVRKVCGVEERTMRRIYAHVNQDAQDEFRQALRGRFVEEIKR